MLCYELVERLVAKRFTSHVNLHTLLPAQQYAYRPFHSTETAVFIVHNNLVRAVDDCRVSELVLLDLSAAFDTVDMYADDTQLYDSSSLVDAESVRDRLTSCVSNVQSGARRANCS